MAEQTIDYDKLAQQHGGTAVVDYDALAKQHGAIESGADAKQGMLSSFAERSGLTGIGQAIAHPIDTITGIPSAIAGAAKQGWQDVHDEVNMVRDQGLTQDTRRKIGGDVPILGPALKQAQAQHDAGNNAGMIGTLAGTVAGFAGPKALEEAAPAVSRFAKDIPDQYRGVRSKIVGGAKLDEVITGDTVTPRQRYETAKAQGVNLDTAQATGSPVANLIKRPTEHSLGGTAKFEANNEANVQALHEHAQNILDSVDPKQMSREDFGNAIKTRLVQDQQALNDQAGSIYKDLDAQIGGTKPSTADIRQTAQKVVDANKAYYEAHPDLLSGGAGKAWRIVNNLAESGEPVPPTVKTSAILDASGNKITSEVPGVPKHQDTWSDLHKLRSDLLDITRSPEIIGDRPTGWIKQLTGAVDRSMTGIAGTPEADAFRDANEIYKHMKQAYDNPLSKLYHIVRSPDGLTAANSLASITPDIAKQIGNAAPELLPQLQRQTIDRILRPTGNELPDLKNLSARFGRTQKEQLSGVLTPEQIKSLENLGRTSKLVTFDANPSGSGKLSQKSNEMAAMYGGAGTALTGVVTGNPVLVGVGAAPAAYAGAQRIAASKMTNPAFTESIMNAPLKGTAKWVSQGEAKLLEHVANDSASALTSKDIAALSNTPQGKSILVRASSLTPGSSAMKNLLKSVKP